jgi:glycosyltransferase involved in cell wall biosynthesis
MERNELNFFLGNKWLKQQKKSMKVALVYDRVNKFGGAERVLLSLNKLFPDAPIFTSVYNEKTASWAKKFSNIHTSFLQSFPFAKGNHELFAPLMPLAFELFTFDEYDLVISITSEAAKGIRTKPHTVHICYCLTPTRYLWSGYEDYFPTPLFRIFTYPMVFYLKWWDKVSAYRPDAIVSISQEVKKRVKDYYDIVSTYVIYPPANLPEEKDTKEGRLPETSDYFLIVSRLVPYKRIDLAIKACNNLGIPLKIIGTGSQKKELQKMAGSTIEFLGSLTDAEVVRYYKQSRGFLFPGKEDFGITIIEAQQYGKPVLAYRGGGALETIVEGKTGMFFDKQTINSFQEALQKFIKKRYNPDTCRKQAEKFREERFLAEFKQMVEKVVRSKK